jgi:hypothetical protein
MRKPVCLFCLLSLTLAAWTAAPPSPAAGSKDWPPVTDEEKAMKDCPQQPGASAIFLYREEVTDSGHGEYRVFRRLKILTPAGRDQANIEIPYFKGEDIVRDLEARVVPPQGEPREFTGQVFEKTAFRVRGIRMTVKTFALPDVEAGSIIDYRYKIVRDTGGSTGGAEDILDALQISPGKPREGPIGKGMKLLSIPADNWEVQEELFTRKAKFVYIPSDFMGYVMDILFNGPGSLMWFTQRMPNIHPAIKDRRLELELENVPAFEAEELMTPEESEKMAVNIFYSDSQFDNQQEYWKRECQNWQKAAEGFIGDVRKLTAEAQKLVEGVTDPVSKLKSLYERAQRIRNLSYEKNLTSKQRKAQKIKDNRKAAEVLEHDYGFRSDITRTFVALAQAAGFEAEVARVSTRDDKLFRVLLLSFTEQLDSEVAIVKLGDKELLFDPATPFCPFGLVHWSRSNATAVRYSKTPPAFFTTSVYPPEMALTQRELALQVDAQGGLIGTAKVTYTGHEALVRRLEHIHSDEADRKKGLEEELSSILPMGAGVTLKQLENIDNSAANLILLFDISLPGVVTMAGDKMLLPASPLLGTLQYPFRHARRKYPIYFPFPFREFNDIVITLPEGMIVETRPAPLKNQHDFATCSLVCTPEGTQRIHVQRDLVIKKSFFPVDQYAAIKGFYDWVRASDEEQVVLAREKR